MIWIMILLKRSHFCITVSLLMGLCSLTGPVNGIGESVRVLKEASEDFLFDSLSKFSNRDDVAFLSGESNIRTAESLPISKLKESLMQAVSDSWNKLTDPQLLTILRAKGAHKEILANLADYKAALHFVDLEQLRQLELKLTNLNWEHIKDMAEWHGLWDKAKGLRGIVNELHKHLEGFIDLANEAEPDKLNEFVNAIKASNVFEELKNLHEVLAGGSDRKHLFAFLGSSIGKGEEHLCWMMQSPAQLMYNLYNLVALTDIKGFAIIQFSYMILKINDADNKMNYQAEADKAREEFERFSEEKLTIFRSVLPKLSQEFYKCDPTSYTEGESYLEVMKLMQGYIENEVDMSDNGSCNNVCGDYSYAKAKGCYKDLFCKKQKQCEGRIFDCKFFHADAWVCMSQDPNRRYDWVEYEDGTELGTKNECPNKIKVDSWWRYLFWHCSYCFCKCEDHTDPTREVSWSLVQALTNTSANMVVTGLRFVKQNKIFFIQIEEARALPEGGVDESSKHWVDLPNNLQPNEVFEMSYEKRSLDLDKLEAPEGTVLTGVKLRTIGGHLNLEIQATPVNFSSGQLMKSKSFWLANDKTPADAISPRKALPILMPDIPTRYKGQNTVDSYHNEFLTFDTTSDFRDVGQTIIPFLDSQPVTPSPSSWLSGAGLYHKGHTGYGGFVGISVLTFDYSKYL